MKVETRAASSPRTVTGQAALAWQAPQAVFPQAGSPHEKLRFCLRYAILAPSPFYTQPWLFRPTRRGVDLLADATRALPNVDPAGRELTMSCGALLFALQVAARYFGLHVEVELFPTPGTPGHVARVSLGGEAVPTIDECTLFFALTKPRRDATAVDTPPPSAALLEALAGCARTHAAWLRFADTRRSWRALIGLVCDGELRQRADARFQADLARELFRDEISAAGPADSAGFADFVAPGWSQAVATTTQPARQRGVWVAREPMPVPVFAALGTPGDSSNDWIAAGQAMMHMVLHARAAGVGVTDFNQPLRVEALRPLVRGALAASGFAQGLYRIGHGVQVEPVPRRRLEAMLLPGNGQRRTS